MTGKRTKTIEQTCESICLGRPFGHQSKVEVLQVHCRLLQGRKRETGRWTEEKAAG
jgi:hypothetical protein